jgi:hypothetical protein
MILSIDILLRDLTAKHAKFLELVKEFTYDLAFSSIAFFE